MKLCGILLPVFSLPSPYGVGTLGKAAYDFVDFLHAAGQQIWQVLPLHPTGYGNSPYYTQSCFAGNPWLIDLDFLAQEGLLTKQELSAWPPPEDSGRVDYRLLEQRRSALLFKAFARASRDGLSQSRFLQGSRWLEPYGAFMAQKDSRRHWNAVRLERQAAFHRFLQEVFYRQWFSLKAYANARDVQIIGDVPFYVPRDSADVFTRPELFYLDEAGKPSLTAGCPPDQFNAQGQLWGSPVYRWDVMQNDGYRWWLERIDWANRCFDGLRLDHFRGFESFWAVPAGARSAAQGRWMPGPGKPFLDALKDRFPGTWFWAEDLGDITPQVRSLLRDTGFWGMRVIQFGFETDYTNEHLPHRYKAKTVAYTSLHDTMTAKQWLFQAPQWQVRAARRYLGKEKLSVWDLICDVLSSPAQAAVIAMQDYLQLGPSARMNCPGTVGPQNWSWRMEASALEGDLAQRIRKLCLHCGRKPA